MGGKARSENPIGEARSAMTAGSCPCSFFASLWTSTPSRSINTQKKKEKKRKGFGQYPGILTEQLWSITYMYSEAPLIPVIRPYTITRSRFPQDFYVFVLSNAMLI